MRLEFFHRLFIAAASLLLVGLAGWFLSREQGSLANLALALLAVVALTSLGIYWLKRRGTRRSVE